MTPFGYHMQLSTLRDTAAPRHPLTRHSNTPEINQDKQYALSLHSGSIKLVLCVRGHAQHLGLQLTDLRLTAGQIGRSSTCSS